jgi:hypothetical protein
MATKQKTVSGGSSTTHGKPVKLDYRQMLVDITKEQQPPEEWGDVMTIIEITEITGYSRPQVSKIMDDGLRVGKIRGMKTIIGGHKKRVFPAKDVYEYLKGR